MVVIAPVENKQTAMATQMHITEGIESIMPSSYPCRMCHSIWSPPFRLLSSDCHAAGLFLDDRLPALRVRVSGETSRIHVDMSGVRHTTMIARNVANITSE